MIIARPIHSSTQASDRRAHVEHTPLPSRHTLVDRIGSHRYMQMGSSIKTQPEKKSVGCYELGFVIEFDCILFHKLLIFYNIMHNVFIQEGLNRIPTLDTPMTVIFCIHCHRAYRQGRLLRRGSIRSQTVRSGEEFVLGEASRKQVPGSYRPNGHFELQLPSTISLNQSSSSSDSSFPNSRPKSSVNIHSPGGSSSSNKNYRPYP